MYATISSCPRGSGLWGVKMFFRGVAIAVITGIPVFASSPPAYADDIVTYEVISTSDIAAANVEYSDIAGRRELQQVPLPWRVNATVGNARSNDAAISANWRPHDKPYHFVTVRVYTRGTLLCEVARDTGAGACYGSATFKT
jgi:hypothetical protein